MTNIWDQFFHKPIWIWAKLSIHVKIYSQSSVILRRTWAVTMTRANIVAGSRTIYLCGKIALKGSSTHRACNFRNCSTYSQSPEQKITGFVEYGHLPLALQMYELTCEQTLVHPVEYDLFFVAQTLTICVAYIPGLTINFSCISRNHCRISVYTNTHTDRKKGWRPADLYQSSVTPGVWNTNAANRGKNAHRTPAMCQRSFMCVNECWCCWCCWDGKQREYLFSFNSLNSDQHYALNDSHN